MSLSREFLAEQKTQLLTEEKRLGEELARIAKKDPVVPGDYDATFPDYGRDPEQNAQEEENYEARVGVEHSLELHLREVREALDRLERGTYGVCSVCHTVIDEERLKAFPAAETCVAHA
jgi:DnaK suppressor protein